MAAPFSGSARRRAGYRLLLPSWIARWSVRLVVGGRLARGRPFPPVRARGRRPRRSPSRRAELRRVRRLCGALLGSAFRRLFRSVPRLPPVLAACAAFCVLLCRSSHPSPPLALSSRRCMRSLRCVPSLRALLPFGESCVRCLLCACDRAFGSLAASASPAGRACAHPVVLSVNAPFVA